MGNPVPLLGSIVYLQASNKLVGDPQSPGGYPHICEGKFMVNCYRPEIWFIYLQNSGWIGQFGDTPKNFRNEFLTL